jgi:hypothetical protein
MNSQTFEGRLSRVLADYANDAVQPIDAIEIATGAMTGRRPTGWRAGFGTLSPTVRLLLIGGALLALAAAVAFVGSELLRRTAEPLPAYTIERVGRLAGAYESATVFLLPSGRLFIAGHVATAEVFDPSSGVAQQLAADQPSLSFFDALLLDDGRVFLYGWEYAEPTSNGRSAGYLFDPTTGGLSGPIPTLHQRFEASFTGLADGRILLAGGLEHPESSTTLDSTEIFDPKADVFVEGAVLPSARMGQRSMGLADGSVPLVGGSTGDAQNVGTPIQRVERFDAATGASNVVGVIENGRRGSPVVVQLADGRILLVSSENGAVCGRHEYNAVRTYVFDPQTNKTTRLGSLPHTIRGALGLTNGRVVVSGEWQAIPGGCGSGSDYINGVWLGIYDPETGITLETPDALSGAPGTLPLTTSVAYVGGVVLDDGRVALVSRDNGYLLTLPSK